MSTCSYDNDQLCVLNVCESHSGNSCSVKTITVADTPYSTLEDDSVILVDATGGAIIINLVEHAVLPNHSSYTFKRKDSTSNTITIVPPGGETVNGSATYTLPRVTEVVELCHDSTNNNWEVINDKLDRALTTKGDTFVHNGSHVVRIPVGTNNQVLTADNTAPGGVKWAAGGGGGGSGNIAYSLLQNRVIVFKVAYTSVAYFPWNQSRHGTYPAGTVIFQTTIGNRDLNIRLFNKTTSTSLGSIIGIVASGSYTFNITNPTANAQLELQVGTNSQGGFRPEIFGALLEFV